MFLFIPSKNLNDTKTLFDKATTNLVMVNIVHKWKVCAILPMTKISILVNVNMIQII
jgi:hypothetical protein